MGEPVRYDGLSKGLSSPILDQWRNEDRLIVVCPEVIGGLSVPRLPAEIQPDSRIINTAGNDVTCQFQRGALIALSLCKKHNVQIAILKESSPSCGSQWVYDGTFSGNKVQGKGVTTRLLSAHGIHVFNETELNKVASLISELESVC